MRVVFNLSHFFTFSDFRFHILKIVFTFFQAIIKFIMALFNIVCVDEIFIICYFVHIVNYQVLF